jgi:Bacterial Ig-like domain (group 1)/PKD domain
MVSEFMITRFLPLTARGRVRLAFLLIVVPPLAVVACEKVPLLAPTGSTITLTSSATTLPVNGTTTLIAQVLEASGTPPHSGTNVTFTTTLGTVQPSEVSTDTAGRAVVTFVAGAASGTATITAISGGAGGGATSTTGTGGTSAANTVKIAIGAAAVGKINLSANPAIVPSTGGTSTLTANVVDINGNVLPGVPVSFSTTAGTLTSSFVNSDQNGSAQTVLTTNKQATVTATAGTSSTGGTGTGATTTAPTTATVTVSVNTPPNVSVGAASPATPTVGQSVTFPLTYTSDANSSPIQRLVADFGDGTSSVTFVGTPTSVNHTYTSSGTFAMRVTAFDAFGSQSTGGTSVLIGAKPQPTVSISTTTTNPTAGTDVAFTASVTPAAGSGTNITEVTVDYGDLSPKTDLGPSTGTFALHHTYLAGGTFPVVLTATDSNGGVGRATTTVFVQTATPLTVLLSATATPNGTSTTESFTATVIGLGNSVVVNYHWVFGGTNGTADTTSNQQTRTYAAGSGTITVTVTITTSTGAQQSGSTVIVVP